MLVEWVYNQNTEDGKYFSHGAGTFFSISFNSVRGIDAETCWVDNVFPPDGLCFSSGI